MAKLEPRSADVYEPRLFGRIEPALPADLLVVAIVGTFFILAGERVVMRCSWRAA